MPNSAYSGYKPFIVIGMFLVSLGCHPKEPKSNVASITTSEAHTSDDIRSGSGDAIVCAFFGLDNALPLRANALAAGAFGKDGMPVNFKDEIDATILDAKDFLVIDREGGEHIPIAATLKPADEVGENRTVLLIGEFGSAASNPPAEVRIVGDLQTKAKHENASANSIARNLRGASTKNVIPLTDGPRMFFAQIISGDLAELKDEGFQVVQVAWQGGITPVDAKIAEEALFKFYTVYVEADGGVKPLTPTSIADINDNDNYHQLMVETQLPIVKVSMTAGVVKDPNGDPNPETQVLVGR